MIDPNNLTTSYIATDIIVPVPDLRSGDTILDQGEAFRLYDVRHVVPGLASWRAYDAQGDLVPLPLERAERRRVVGREG